MKRILLFVAVMMASYVSFGQFGISAGYYTKNYIDVGAHYKIKNNIISAGYSTIIESGDGGKSTHDNIPHAWKDYYKDIVYIGYGRQIQKFIIGVSGSASTNYKYAEFTGGGKEYDSYKYGTKIIADFNLGYSVLPQLDLIAHYDIKREAGLSVRYFIIK